MLSFRIIPVFLAHSSLHCDDINRFVKRPPLKLIGTTFNTVTIKGKIPSNFQFDELVIKSRAFISALRAAEEAVLTYWEGFKHTFQSIDGNVDTFTCFEAGKNGEWYLFVIERGTNLPLMRFYINESW